MRLNVAVIIKHVLCISFQYIKIYDNGFIKYFFRLDYRTL